MSKTECPIEDIECEIFHNWLEERGILHTHIPNESKSQTKAAIVRGQKLKRMGVSPGYWDYDIYIPVIDIDGTVGGYELIKIEMKRAKKSLSTVSANQKKWGKVYELAGIPCYICYGSEAAQEVVEEVFEQINQEKLKQKPIDF